MAKLKKFYCEGCGGDFYLLPVDKIDLIKYDTCNDSIILYVNGKSFSFDLNLKMKGLTSFDLNSRKKDLTPFEFFLKFEKKLNEEVSDDCIVLDIRIFLNSLLN